MHGLNILKHSAGRISFVFAILLVSAMTVNAYTIVMLGGRRIEIPTYFVVTEKTLTYEVSTGVQVTLAMAAIDIAATEKANNELPGSLMRRVHLGLTGSHMSIGDKPVIGAMPASRTITNRDLESSRRRRRDSEATYESRRKQLGLPSVEESRKQAAKESALIGMELQERRVAERESENYWRQRATTLRTEMAAVDAELAYIRARLDEGPLGFSNGWTGGWSSVSFSGITPGLGFGNFGHRSFGNFRGRRDFPAHPRHRPNIFVAPNRGAQVTGRVSLGGGATRGQVFLNPGTFRHGRPVGVGGSFPAFPNVAVIGSTLPGYDFSYERSALITHFNELGTTRAGLKARWRELEDEARRAGAPPGWLRP